MKYENPPAIVFFFFALHFKFSKVLNNCMQQTYLICKILKHHMIIIEPFNLVTCIFKFIFIFQCPGAKLVM